jgi:secondary thiamine-phosphate synthase enzyme
MIQFSRDLELSTPGEVALLDVTQQVAEVVRASGVRLGQALVFTTSSTSAITVTEFEPGLLEDIPAALERLFPKGLDYGHERRWRDGNGHSHVRAAFLKPDLVVPVREGRLLLGAWQQIVFVELDNRPRDRRVAVHVWGA